MSFMFDVAGNKIFGLKAINKFGRATNVDDSIATDVWDRANTIDDQVIWTAPTTARIHDITSASISDTSAGTGARTIRVSGLTGWTTTEISEDITLNGTSNVPTTNSYVIVNRMEVLTKGAEKVNWGNITATAQTDSTVTAQIISGNGQTQTSVFGFSSTQSMYIPQYYASLVNAAGGAEVILSLVVNPEPDLELINFIIKHTIGVRGGGSSDILHSFQPYKTFAGPAIIKIQALSDSDNMDVSAGFDGILETS